MRHAVFKILNRETLVQFWDGEIEYTEDVLDKLQQLGER